MPRIVVSERPETILPIRKFIQERVLARLPRRASRYGYDILRWWDRRAIGGDESGQPVAVLATHDLSRSGAPWVVLEIATTLQAAGYAVTLVSMADGPMRDDFEAIGINVLIDCYPTVRKGYLARLAAVADIAIANTVVTAPIVAAWAPHVVTAWYLHEISLLEAMLADGSIAAPLAGATSIWAGSEMCARIVRPVRPDVAVFPYGMAPIGAPASPRAPGRYRIAVFGSIEPRKGQDFVVDAVVLLDDVLRRKVSIDFYGRVLDADFARAIKARAEPYRAIRFMGEVDRTAYLDALRGVDAVLVSSRDDTLPLVSIDALSAERVLMLVPSVGTTAWLNDDVDSLIAQETSAKGIAGLIARAVESSDRASGMGMAARRVFDREFSQAAFRTKLLTELDRASSGVGDDR
ncbi:glycosyltransferase family 4 protein [Sphingomonas oligophenolica]|uniref:Glycosyltransferase n=1 Tax=Sphingomonas oligophenolica TaxID=301154 RepID=A0A502C5R1_9SPHN|nr:glycosyltransferase family 4 protein [Sphingomonas oligophenolica]TPG08132.1 glycosyltransferase [Sphingomonas oligophenolica]